MASGHRSENCPAVPGGANAVLVFGPERLDRVLGPVSNDPEKQSARNRALCIGASHETGSDCAQSASLHLPLHLQAAQREVIEDALADGEGE